MIDTTEKFLVTGFLAFFVGIITLRAKQIGFSTYSFKFLVVSTVWLITSLLLSGVISFIMAPNNFTDLIITIFIPTVFVFSFVEAFIFVIGIPIFNKLKITEKEKKSEKGEKENE